MASIHGLARTLLPRWTAVYVADSFEVKDAEKTYVLFGQNRSITSTTRTALTYQRRTSITALTKLDCLTEYSART